MCEKAFKLATEQVEGVRFFLCKEDGCVEFPASTQSKAEMRMGYIQEVFPYAREVDVAVQYGTVFHKVFLGSEVLEECFFENELGRITVKMEKGTPNEIAYCYIGDKCAFIHYTDIPQIVEALVTKDWSAMDGLVTKSAIMHDLYDADIITYEEYRNC